MTEGFVINGPRDWQVQKSALVSIVYVRCAGLWDPFFMPFFVWEFVEISTNR